MRTIASSIVLGFILATPAAADELRLKNGDRITGQVVSLDSGKLTFKVAGADLLVAWDDVAALTIAQPMLVTVKGGQPELRTLDGLVLGDVVTIAAPPPPLRWSGGINLGYVTSSGNTDVTNFRFDQEVIATRPKDRFSEALAINRADDSGERTADNWNLSLNYDRFLTPRLYINGNAIFTSDEFKSLDLRTALGAAIGYDVWKTPRGILSVNGGLGYVNENFTDPLEDDDYFALREGVRALVVFAGSQVEAFHDHDTYIGLTGDDNLFFRMRNGVRFKLIGRLAATIQNDLDYDRSPAPGRDNADSTFAITLGYRF